MAETAAAWVAPPRKRETWSIRRIAEDIGGRPISDFQDPPASRLPPSNPLPPRARAATAVPPTAAGRGPLGGANLGPSRGRTEGASGRSVADPIGGASEMEAIPDPVERVYPPLTRSTGRALHGSENEHHRETLEQVRAEPAPPEPGRRSYPPGPSARPERIYLHYLLLHLDRLSDHALHYLERSVSEEMAHRRASLR